MHFLVLPFYHDFGHRLLKYRSQIVWDHPNHRRIIKNKWFVDFPSFGSWLAGGAGLRIQIFLNRITQLKGDLFERTRSIVQNFRMDPSSKRFEGRV